MGSSANLMFYDCSISLSLHPFKSNLSSMAIIPAKKLKREQHQKFPLKKDFIKNFKNNCNKLVDGFVDSVFEFSDQPLHPNQSNLAPVEEIGAAVEVTDIEGTLPQEFPQGIFIRNGPNPAFGGLKSTHSMFGRSSYIWVEGEGMVHAVYLTKHPNNNNKNEEWKVLYNNRYIQTDTFRIENHFKNRPCFLPAVEGDSLAVLSAFFLNWLRFGEVNRDLSNTNVFGHAGKYYTVAENSMPQQIDILTLESLGTWDLDGAWNRPFTSHPRKTPGIGELVIMGIAPTKPFMEIGIISEDGKRVVHKVDVKLSRSSLTHEIGVTQRYNVILDYPVTIDLNRLIRGGSLIKYDKKSYAKIGVMPRYGDADSIQWFHVKPNCTMHLFNCFEHNHEVVVWGCRATDSVIPGPEKGVNKFEWFSERFKEPLINTGHDQNVEDGSSLRSRVYEWRLDLETGKARERHLTATQFSMDFPFINPSFIGLQNKFGYAQVLHSMASSNSGMFKFGGLAKLYFEEPQSSSTIKVEYHMLESNCFCSGASFVAKQNGVQEDDGWIITFIHNELTNISQVYVIDANKFSDKPVAKITLPYRVPYGFHGAFMPFSFNKQ